MGDITVHTPLRDNEDEMDIDVDINIDDVAANSNDHSNEEVITDANEFMVVKDGTLTSQDQRY